MVAKHAEDTEAEARTAPAAGCKWDDSAAELVGAVAEAGRGAMLRRRFDDVLDHADPSEYAQITDALTAAEDDLDGRFFGPPPSRAAALAATLDDLHVQYGQRRVLADRSISRAAAADLLGIRPQAVTERLAAGQMVGLKIGRQWRLPAWQFAPDSDTGVLPGLERIQRVFPGGPVTLSTWIGRVNPDLDDRAPRDVLAAGDVDRVCAVAAALTAAGW